MAQDYAKKSKKKKSKAPKQSGRLLITLLLLGGFILGLVYLGQLQQNHPTNAAQVTQLQAKPQNESENKAHKPRFSFYTMLPQMQVNNSESSKQAETTTKASQFILQIASFRQYKDADQLKAQLTLMGYEVDIKKVRKGKLQLHRVQLGPFDSKQAAIHVQRKLKVDHFSSLLRSA